MSTALLATLQAAGQATAAAPCTRLQVVHRLMSIKSVLCVMRECGVAERPHQPGTIVVTVIHVVVACAAEELQTLHVQQQGMPCGHVNFPSAQNPCHDQHACQYHAVPATCGWRSALALVVLPVAADVASCRSTVQAQGCRKLRTRLIRLDAHTPQPFPQACRGHLLSLTTPYTRKGRDSLLLIKEHTGVAFLQ